MGEQVAAESKRKISESFSYRYRRRRKEIQWKLGSSQVNPTSREVLLEIELDLPVIRDLKRFKFLMTDKTVKQQM